MCGQGRAGPLFANAQEQTAVGGKHFQNKFSLFPDKLQQDQGTIKPLELPD